MQIQRAILWAGLFALCLFGCRSNRNEIPENENPDVGALEAQVKESSDRIAATEAELKRNEEESKKAIEKLKADLLGFSLQYKHSSKCLEVESASQQDGARLRQMPCNFTNIQKFRLIERAGGNWIQNLVTGKCLVAQDNGRDNGTRIVQAACGDSGSMFFTLQSDDMGYIFIRELASNRCVDIEAISKADAAGAQIYDCVGGDAQRVKIVQANP
jgi:hypothetical protein